MSKEYGLGIDEEILESWYIRDNFKVTYDECEVDKSIHDTVIYVYRDFREMQQAFSLFRSKLYGAGLIHPSQYKIEFDGLRFLFKHRDKVLPEKLRGYDKRNTIIINRGGL
ncbi:hypothetical protein VPHK406_0214 [Vibrio phage K406]